MIADIELAIKNHIPVVIVGKQGTGKTTLVENMGKLVQLGDSSDGQILLGCYVMRGPGKFEFQPGILTKAVINGYCLVIEDIDLASNDIMAVLMPLLETRVLRTSRGEKHIAHPNFNLICTASRSLGNNLFLELNLEEPTKEKMHSMVPRIDLVDIFWEIKSFLAVKELTLRDFFRWYNRIQDKTNPEELFIEAVDCFCSFLSSLERATEIAMFIGTLFNIDKMRVEFFMEHYIPVIDGPKFGRVTLVPKRNEHISAIAFAKTTLRYLEKIAVAIHHNEPVLLVGETGTGKTTIIQHVAHVMGKTLHVVNMSQQSDSSDLLGGFKPLDLVMMSSNLLNEFLDLFEQTFSLKQNSKFISQLHRAYSRKKYRVLCDAFTQGIKMALKLHEDQLKKSLESVRKRIKSIEPSVFISWENFSIKVHAFASQIETQQFLFDFVEGTLIRALTKGDWVLLDEINLASPETLETIQGVLSSKFGSLYLFERGDEEMVPRHTDFRLFAAMNPAGDVGKKTLPTNIHNKFTEIWIDPPKSKSDLLLIIEKYCGFVGENRAILDDIVLFFFEARDLANKKELFDGAGTPIHFSLRTLTRALTFASFIEHYGARRALYEGLTMTFLTGLNAKSFTILTNTLKNTILRTIKDPIKFVELIPQQPSPNHVLIDCFWLECGKYDIPENIKDSFVITPSVSRNLRNLARACVATKYPILIQGPTSAGKTSMIEYIAKLTGHKFIRVNNHEHTDLQEYLGTYAANEQGVLVFQEGILVEALRNGYWIVLDELNLAPSDVLEALNRLLDDNRELFLPEKQEIIKPHPDFMLFATQNPAGQYGGRKLLSRALRNRFLELHVDEIPEDELEIIIEKRCLIPKSYAHKLVVVYKRLTSVRDASKIFDGRSSFITLRDLFRWALRKANGYEELAFDGYMLLAERVRKPQDRTFILNILEDVMKVKLSVTERYEKKFDELHCEFFDNKESSTKIFNQVVWTHQMKKLFVLVAKASMYDEPVLLIGETGCGKTTVCQVLAETLNQKLHIVNAHQNSETADFLGSQRPARKQTKFKELLFNQIAELGVKFGEGTENLTLERAENLIAKWETKYASEIDTLQFNELRQLLKRSRALFEWVDGPLIQAMKSGDLFLLDEISLAEDAVLERLNSVLEPSRQITLVEQGGSEVNVITADSNFHIFATMNPGGDYGKKELSPALRNRFTEIWVPQVSNSSDVKLILENNLDDEKNLWANNIFEFLSWFSIELQKPWESITSLRDLLAWARFISKLRPQIGNQRSFYHGGCMVFVDGIGINPLYGLTKDYRHLAKKCQRKLQDIACLSTVSEDSNGSLVFRTNEFGVEPFFIPFGLEPKKDVQFSFNAPTTHSNAVRVFRAFQLSKPILLEGSPGAGKTSLISTLAALSGNKLVRINLSEQTDLMDLFGSDLPVEGGEGGQFSWRDGPFLQAMTAGNWVLLDELNLASQQVLEGLNACLDHRATVYIPELDKSFPCHPKFRVFAAQNPQGQGGGRKGLPKSFLNRFTLVYVEELVKHDLITICSNIYPQVDVSTITKMIDFNEAVKECTMELRKFGLNGSPWEFNLRDVIRWLELMVNNNSAPTEHFNTLYWSRMRSQSDRDAMLDLFESFFGKVPNQGQKIFKITDDALLIGRTSRNRSGCNFFDKDDVQVDTLQFIHSQLDTLESLLKCVNSQTLGILVGPPASGKSSMIRLLAAVCGEKLDEFAMNPGVDALEILGSFEQVDTVRSRQRLLADFKELIHISGKRIVKAMEDQGITVEQVFSELQVNDDQAITENLRYFIDSFYSSLHQDRAKLLNQRIQEFTTKCAESSLGRFEWIDSTLINAIEMGHWILIDNANLCSSSVLDRLNSLLEVGGSLQLAERGLVNGEVKIIHPHPNFRMFMSLDPKNGEISRAMRNRAIEIFVGVETPHLLEDKCRKLRASLGVPFNFGDAGMSSAKLRFECARILSGKPNLEFHSSATELKLLMPGIWPHFVTGKQWISNPHCAERMMDISLIDCILKGMNTFQQPLIDDTPKQADLVLMAVELYFRSLPINGSLHTIELFKLLDFSEYQQTIILSDSEVVRESKCNEVLLQSRKEVLKLNGLEMFEDELPLDLRVLNLPIKHGKEFETYEYFIRCWLALRRILVQRLKKEKHYSSAHNTSHRQLSIAQLSYLVFCKEIRKSMLPHRCVPHIYHLLEVLHEIAMDENIPIEVRMRFIIHWDQLWESSIASEFSSYTLLVLLQCLEELTIKHFAEISNSIFVSLKNLLALISTELGLDKISKYGIFKQRTLTSAFTNEEVKSVADNLSLIDKQLDFWQRNPFDWLLKPTSTNTETQRTMVVEAMATLQLYDKEQFDSKGLYDIIQLTTAKLGNIVESNTDPGILKGLNDSQKRIGDLMSWPIHDAKILSREYSIIQNLGNFLKSSDFAELKNLGLQINEVLQNNNSTSLPPLHFTPFQRLFWLIDAVDNINILNVANWSNALTNWHAGTDNEYLQSLYCGKIPDEIIHGNAAVEISNLGSKYPPHVLGNSSFQFKMISKLHITPVYSAPSKINQLKVIAMEIDCSNSAKNRPDDSDYKLLDTMKNSLLSLSSQEFEGDYFRLCASRLDLKSGEKSLERIGLAWISFAQLFLEEYIPKEAIDPVDIRIQKTVFARNEISLKLAELCVVYESQILRTGNCDIDQYKLDLERSIKSLKTKETKWKKNLPLRPKVSLIGQIHSELMYLKNEILRPESVESIVYEFTQNLLSEETLERETHLQDFLESTLSRMASDYNLYMDLLSPVFLAIRFLKYGLRLIRANAILKISSPSDEIVVKVLDFLNGFNYSSSLEVFNLTTKLKKHENVNSKVNLMLAVVERSIPIIQEELQAEKEHCDLISEVFFTIQEQWVLEEKIWQESLDQEDNIYQVKELKTQEQQEEEELAKLFPDYATEFDLPVEEMNEVPSPQVEKDNHGFGLKVEVVELFERFCKSLSSSEEISQPILQLSYQNAFNYVGFYLNDIKSMPSSISDQSLQEGLLVMTNICIQKFEIDPSSEITRNYDFYRDSNFVEIQLLEPVLRNYEAVLNRALQKWPEHSVLCILSNLVKKLISLPLTTPIIKVLVGLEFLMIKTDDWEAYSSKEYSLKEALSQIILLIVRWRKYELQTWIGLLKVEESKARDKIASEWSYLWKLVVGTLFSELKESYDESLLNETTEVISNFVHSGSAGEFSRRLSLIKHFSTYCRVMAINWDKENLRIIRVLDNVYSYFNQFSDLVEKKLEALRQPIQKELREYTQIASWKDVNVYALKESAKRTHYQLNKIIKKYRIVLATPTRDFLLGSQLSTIPTIEMPLDVNIIVENHYKTRAKYLIQIPESKVEINFNPQFSNLFRIKQIENKAISFAKKILDSTEIQHLLISLNDNSCEIFTTFKEFTELNGKEKNHKGLKTIRRKSWIDFLKYLKYLGLNARGRAKYHQYKDRVFIFGCEILRGTETFHFSVGLQNALQKSKDNFYKTISGLELLNTAMNSHSNDVTKLEAECCFGFVMHLLHIMARQRATMESLIFSFSRISAGYDQLSDSLNLQLNNHSWPICNAAVIVKILKKSFPILNVSLASGILITEKLGSRTELCLWLKDTKQQCGSLCNEINLLAKEMSQSGSDEFISPFKTSSLMQKCKVFFDSVILRIEKNSDDSRLVSNILDIIRGIQIEIDETLVAIPERDESLENLLEIFLAKVMVAIQHLRKEIVSNSTEDEKFPKEGFVEIHNNFLQTLNEVHLKEVAKLFPKVLAEYARKGSSDFKKFTALIPILGQFKQLFKFRLEEFILLHATETQFALVSFNSILLVLQKGFCISEENENDETIEDEHAVEGTGIGDGEGSRDVSNEIDNQEELEGLQNDQPQEQSNEQIKEEENGIEMDNDFDGLLEDLSFDEENEEENDDLKEAEEQMGNLDEDLADAIDEKAWGDQEEPANNANEKLEQNSKLENTSGENEIVAGDDTQVDRDNESNLEEKDKEQGNSDHEEIDTDKMDDEINDEGNIEENLGLDIKEDNTIDLDNDKNFDEVADNEEQDDDVGSPEEQSKNESVNEKKEEEDLTEQVSEIDLTDEIDNSCPEDANQDLSDDEPDQMEVEDHELPTEMNEQTLPDPVNEENKNAEASEEDGPTNEIQAVDEPLSSNQDLGVNGETGTRSGNNTGIDDEAGMLGQENMESEMIDELGGTDNLANNQQEKSSSDERRASTKTNPLRSVGSALEDWQKRLKNIQDGSDESAESKPMLDQNEQEFDAEYVMEGDENEGDGQAVGVANWEQIDKMDEPFKHEELDYDNELNSNISEDDNIKNNDNIPVEKQLNPTLNDQKEETTSEKGIRDNILDQQEKSIHKEMNTEVQKKKIAHDPVFTMSDEMDVDDEIVDYAAMRNELEDRLITWRKTGSSIEESMSLWKRYEILTKDLGFLLCEQLRLILEPTLSTKLKGDYRTGKRLNMRKIIPYIASNFKKDKIWLRRTKPSKRTYQILLSIDDSMSMSSSHSMQLAFESLALITTAFNQLEVGQVGLLSFGEKVELLHPFEDVWSDQVGAHVLNAFTFEQNKTKVRLLMDQSLEILKNARLSQKANDLWQLQIIMSDGICEDHEYIRNRVLAAAENQVATVFLVLDTRSEEQSILTMSNVSYDIDPVTNEFNTKINRYIDTFPFDYFVLVRNIEELPEILSDILRQFFMFTTE